jgi:hypothetical protein
MFQNKTVAHPMEPEKNKKTAQIGFLFGVLSSFKGWTGSDDMGNALLVIKMIDDVNVYEEEWRSRVLWIPGDSVTTDCVCVCARALACV